MHRQIRRSQSRLSPQEWEGICIFLWTDLQGDIYHFLRMKDSKRSNQRFKKQAPPVWKSKSQTKYHAVGERLRASIVQLAPGTKLPPIRELTGQFGVTAVTMGRAIRKLSEEGVVVVRHGAGCWVAPRKQAPRQRFGFTGEETTELRCKIQSALPHQMAYWKEAARAFMEVYRGTEIDFVPMEGIASPDVFDADMTEISTMQYPEALDSECLLNEPTDETGASRVFFVPHQAHLSCAFYNPVLLEKIGVPTPDFEDFDGQMRWLMELQAKWKKATGSARPLSINTDDSFLLLGEKGRAELVHWLKGREETLPPVLDQRLRRIQPMWSFAVKAKGHFRLATFEAMFNNGEIPVVFSRTAGLFDSYRGSGFEPGCHPCFDSDDEITGVGTGFVIRRDHGRAADALRFAEFLAKPEMQRLLPEHGMVPLQAELFHAGDAPSLWKKSRIAWLRTAEEKSIWRSVVWPEWWQWQRGEIDIATFLADCRRLARLTLFQG
jgi:DNA-binding transcriptional regulator YhcF (GntR family)